MVSDSELLREYLESQSERAFGELVERHLRLVYTVARRKVRDPHLAEDVTQAVFIILFRKAKTLKRGASVAGWLYRTTCFAAADAIKKERRRVIREQQAVEMPPTPADPPDAERAATLLDEAILALREKEREAVVLRFFNNRSLAEVGKALGLSEDAARMRVSRALAQLRKYLTARKMALPVGAIVAALATQASQAAPAGLATAVKTTLCLKAGAGAPPALAIAKSTLKALAWLKFKTAAYTCGALLAAGGLAWVALDRLGPQVWFHAGPRYQIYGTIEVGLPGTPTVPGATSLTGSFVIEMKHGVWTLSLDLPPGNGRSRVKYERNASGLGYYVQPATGSGRTSGRTQHVAEGSPALNHLSPGPVLFASCLHLYFLDYTNAWGWSGAPPSGPGSRVMHPLALASAVQPRGPFVGDIWFLDSGIPSVGREAFPPAAPLPLPFQGEELLSGHILFGALTNVGDVSMPTSFHYRRYFPKPGAKTTNDVAQVLAVSGTVSTIVTAGKTVTVTSQ